MKYNFIILSLALEVKSNACGEAKSGYSERDRGTELSENQGFARDDEWRSDCLAQPPVHRCIASFCC
ncbi:hypothetical protein MPLSOD_150045 [Mesorhizobium sp. SOD10]|nr:hypothetical protein MPLSOD_150045 [Mesorhizobium sp. SOD10]